MIPRPRRRPFRHTFLSLPLRRVLAHYGIATPRIPSPPRWKRTLLWIYKSHQRIDRQIAPILGVLETPAPRNRALVPGCGCILPHASHRLISTTRGIFPAVSDVAREVRYRCFEQLPFEKVRSQVYAEAERHLDLLAENPEAIATLIFGRVD